MPTPEMLKNRDRALEAIGDGLDVFERKLKEPGKALRKLAESLEHSDEKPSDENIGGARATLYHAAGLADDDNIESAGLALQVEADWLRSLFAYDTQTHPPFTEPVMTQPAVTLKE